MEGSILAPSFAPTAAAADARCGSICHYYGTHTTDLGQTDTHQHWVSGRSGVLATAAGNLIEAKLISEAQWEIIALLTQRPTTYLMDMIRV